MKLEGRSWRQAIAIVLQGVGSCARSHRTKPRARARAPATGEILVIQLTRDRQRIAPLELEAAIMHAGKSVARQAVRRSSGGIIELGEQLVNEVDGISRQVELPVSLGPMFLPVAVVVDQNSRTRHAPGSR